MLMHQDGFANIGPSAVVPLVDAIAEPELDFEADLRAQDAWRESQLLQETGGLGSMTRGLMRPGGRHTIVCKHWLRDLCMKGDKCDFLHQYDLARMPECLQWARFGKCPENDCDFRHDTERMECQKYKFGFCKLGSQCRMRHDKIGRNYLPEVMPDWYLKELVPNIFDFVPPLPEETVRSTKMPDQDHNHRSKPEAGWNVPMIPQDAWAAPVDAWAVPAKSIVDLTERNPRSRKGGKGRPESREEVRSHRPSDRHPEERRDDRKFPTEKTRRREDDRREERRRPEDSREERHERPPLEPRERRRENVPREGRSERKDSRDRDRRRDEARSSRDDRGRSSRDDRPSRNRHDDTRGSDHNRRRSRSRR